MILISARQLSNDPSFPPHLLPQNMQHRYIELFLNSADGAGGGMGGGMGGGRRGDFRNGGYGGYGGYGGGGDYGYY